ncbi:hypothetical protein GPALN_011907 [Globodera pallida]|nr:hypothetical protein GPALN_011907 [Globodera pallida]
MLRNTTRKRTMAAMPLLNYPGDRHNLTGKTVRYYTWLSQWVERHHVHGQLPEDAVRDRDTLINYRFDNLRKSCAASYSDAG